MTQYTITFDFDNGLFVERGNTRSFEGTPDQVNDLVWQMKRDGAINVVATPGSFIL